MFNCVLIYFIKGSVNGLVDSDIFVERIVNLPFAPFVNLTIEDGNFSTTIEEEVVWDNNKNIFRCYCGKNMDICENNKSIEKIVKSYTANGWVVRKP